MAPKPLIVATLVGGAIGVPYLASHAPTSASAPNEPAPASAVADSAAPLTPTAAPVMPSGSTAQAVVSYPALEQVLRFDLTRQWVHQQWARKSTWPTEFGLSGVRVQLVTGTHPSSLAGALTYYFNVHEQVEHISFHGRTGDPRILVAFLMRTYEFQPSLGPPGEQLYQVKHGGRVKSELRVRSESISTSGAANSSYHVALELARPNSSRYLPQTDAASSVPSPVAAAGEGAARAANATGSKLKSAVDAYFDKARYATQDEQDQVLWRRWPN